MRDWVATTLHSSAQCIDTDLKLPRFLLGTTQSSMCRMPAIRTTVSVSLPNQSVMSPNPAPSARWVLGGSHPQILDPCLMTAYPLVDQKKRGRADADHGRDPPCKANERPRRQRLAQQKTHFFNTRKGYLYPLSLRPCPGMQMGRSPAQCRRTCSD